MVDERPERVPGLRTKFLNDDIPADRVARVSVTLGLPDGSGYVRLASADPSVQPTFNYCYLQDPNDRRRVREGIRKAAEFLESNAYKDVCDHRLYPTGDILGDDDALDLYIRQTVGTARHVSGTCKMGPDSDPMAVLDQYCHVRGLERLRVVDVSVLPDCIRANTNATTIMIAERVADWMS